jgi:hypothetical protein
MSSNASKRALLVGIDKYKSFGPLSGCVSDVKAIAPLLEYNADETQTRNFECRALLGDKRNVTRKDMISGIGELLSSKADVALFYFAGHGVGMPGDVCLASADGDYIEPGVPLSLLLGKAQNADIKQVIIFLDCCYSGGGGGNALLGSDIAVLRDGIAVFAAARKDQIAKELNGRGEFSTYLGGALEGGAADIRGKVTLAGIYAYLAACFGSWEQRPTFKANLDDAFEIRATRSLVPLDSLRRLPQIFEAATTELRLDPEYERENPDSVRNQHKPVVKRKRDIYDDLTRYRNGKLLEFIGTDYLYWAAMKSLSCRLTPHGRYYWTLARKGLL